MLDYTIFPLGDAALTIDFGNQIDQNSNAKVLNLHQKILDFPFVGFIEAIPAYSSLTVFYDVFLLKKQFPAKSAFAKAKEIMEQLILQNTDNQLFINKKDIIKIPVLYDGQDLSAFAKNKQLSEKEVIAIHSATIYHVYMLGFLPGFAYMGTLDLRITANRKPKPEMTKAGSVAIAGQQTGVYPMDSPGGWQVIGRTPIPFFDAKRNNPTLLKAGDSVLFYPIDAHEFENY
jgi:inhibitor of KinA